MKLSAMLQKIGLDIVPKKDFDVLNLMPLEYASASDLSYVDQAKYLPSLPDSKAGAVFVREKDTTFVPDHMQALVVFDPHLAFAKSSQLFAKPEFCFEKSVQQPKIGQNTIIMPNVFLGNNIQIGKECIVMPGVVIADNVIIGDGCKIFPNVVIYRDTKIGNKVFIHAGSVIGSDGYGYAHTPEGEHIKIEHNGCVVIEDNVEIGANTTIDRAVFGQTLIKKGSKIDNLVQIGHNCVIGEHSLLVAQVGIAGSTTTGRNVILGGQAGTGGHIHIGDFTQVAGRGAVGKNLLPNTKWGGHPLMELEEWKKFFVTLRRIVKDRNQNNKDNKK